MKHTNSKITKIFTMVLMMIISRSAMLSQCNGNITLTTQAQVNAFNCTTVNGNLTLIQDIFSTDPINNLNPIFNANLTTVTGKLLVKSLGGNLNLEGLDGITSCGEIELNGSGINSIGAFQWQLQSCNNFRINQTGLADINNFNFLTCNNIYIENNGISSISGFQNITNLTTLGIVGNINLNAVSSFSNITSIDSLQIFGNSQLSICCFAEPLIPISFSFFINSNAPGCNSAAEINAPPMITCQPSFNAFTSATSCLASVSVTDPIPTDNCGVETYTLQLTNGLGVVSNFLGVPGTTFSYELPIGLNTFRYTATDVSGHFDSCSIYITVTDNIKPQWTTTSPLTVNGICGIDDATALFFANAPLATDNCGVSTYADIFVDTPLCGSSFRRTYTSTATDVNGNVSLPFTTIINIVDNVAPQLTGIPADVTIFCGDPSPTPPMVLAFDQCQGNVSGSITAISSVALGDCTFNAPAETTSFTWSVADGCNNTTSASWTITRINNFTFDLGEDVNVCNQSSYTINPGSIGSSYLWSTGATTQSISVTVSGTYAVTVTQSPGCCHADMINVVFGTSPNASATGNQLNCAGTPVVIMGNSSTSQVTYAWSGPGGFTSNAQNPIVAIAGTYTVVVTNNQGCTATANAVVTLNNAAPNVTTTGGTITCTTTSVMISATSTTANVTYSWSGPGGFTSNISNPVVSTAGSYNVIVTAPNNCVANGSSVVSLNNTLPTSALTSGILTCTTTSTQIVNTPSTNAVSYLWSGPNNFISTAQSPTVTAPGAYNLIVTANNGCTSTNQIAVTQNNTAPNVSAVGGSIPCGSSSVVIQGMSTTAGVNYAWTGPGGFTSGLQNPQVSIVGAYSLVVTSTNGCTSSATATVASDSNAPVVTTSGGSLTCITNSVTLSATSSIPNSTYQWSGPSGFTSTLPNPTVTVSGTYFVEVTAPNNCKTTSTATVINDTSIPTVSIALGSVDCAAGNRQLTATSSLSNAGFSWTGPNGFTSNMPNPTISIAGTYIASTTGSNGCIGQNNIVIANDIAFTYSILTTDAAITTGGTASIAITGGTPTFNIVWDNGVTGPSTTNLTAGNHNVIIVDGLGCTKVIPFIITGPVGTQEDQLAQKITLSPNPATDRIQLSSATYQEITYSIFNSLGQSLTSPTQYKNVIDISSFRPGIYYLKISVNGKTVSKKFIKI